MHRNLIKNDPLKEVEGHSASCGERGIFHHQDPRVNDVQGIDRSGNGDKLTYH